MADDAAHKGPLHRLVCPEYALAMAAARQARRIQATWIALGRIGVWVGMEAQAQWDHEDGYTLVTCRSWALRNALLDGRLRLTFADEGAP